MDTCFLNPVEPLFKKRSVRADARTDHDLLGALYPRSWPSLFTDPVRRYAISSWRSAKLDFSRITLVFELLVPSSAEPVSRSFFTMCVPCAGIIVSPLLAGYYH